MAVKMTKDELPEVMGVNDIKEFLGIGINQAYELVNSGQFHVVRIGRVIRVSKKVFFDWLEGEGLQEDKVI